MTTPILSICIATYKRAGFIGATLDSILGQMQPGVELLIVDGASPDDTADVVARHVSRHPGIRYFREDRNSGIDGDYDKAVSYARGNYCWLMTDDDLLKPGAISKVLAAISEQPGLDLVLVNSEVLNADLSVVLRPKLLPFDADRTYAAGDGNALLAETAGAISFIGCVVIRRAFWLARERVKFYGSLFVHAGVIFQGPLPSRTLVLAEPLISIRYGNAMWTPRGFEIWMSKWPDLIWSFPGLSEHSKAAVTAREPWRQVRKLWLYRGIGGYSRSEYRRLYAGNESSLARILPGLTAVLPSALVNSVASVYCILFARHARMNIYDLARSAHATPISRFVAKILGM